MTDFVVINVECDRARRFPAVSLRRAANKRLEHVIYVAYLCQLPFSLFAFSLYGRLIPPTFKRTI